MSGHVRLLLLAQAMWIGDLAQPLELQLARIQAHGVASLWIDRPVDNPIAVRLSDTLTVVMRVEGQAPLEAVLAQSFPESPGWHLQTLGSPTVTDLSNGQKSRWEQTMLATPLQPGTYQLKLPELSYSEKNGKEHRVEWQPLPVQITTRVAKADVSEARDRTSVEELQRELSEDVRWWPWLLLLVPLLVTAALLMRRRQNALQAAGASPRDVALQQLTNLGRVNLAESEGLERFYTLLSDVLRCYIEQRFKLPPGSRTTQELIDAQRQNSVLDATQRATLTGLLRQSDLAKFARVGLTPEQAFAAQVQARELVEQIDQISTAAPGPVSGPRAPNALVPPAAGTR